MNWSDVKMFPSTCYEIDVPWTSLERQIQDEEAQGLDLNPAFQRIHRWTNEQRIRYLEYVLRGGEVGRNIIIACTDWRKQPTPNYALVDGKQRLETVRRFLRDELPVFGHRYSQIEGHFRFLHTRFRWRVVECRTQADILQLYLDINTGGTPHTPEEIEKVREQQLRLINRKVGGAT